MTTTVPVAPRFVHDSSRISLIEQAIQGYLDSKRPIPLEWISEYLAITDLHHMEPRFDVILLPKHSTLSVTTSHQEMRKS